MSTTTPATENLPESDGHVMAKPSPHAIACVTVGFPHFDRHGDFEPAIAVFDLVREHVARYDLDGEVA